MNLCRAVCLRDGLGRWAITGKKEWAGTKAVVKLGVI
jgi:hypothetical protein